MAQELSQVGVQIGTLQNAFALPLARTGAKEVRVAGKGLVKDRDACAGKALDGGRDVEEEELLRQGEYCDDDGKEQAQERHGGGWVGGTLGCLPTGSRRHQVDFWGDGSLRD